MIAVLLAAVLLTAGCGQGPLPGSDPPISAGGHPPAAPRPLAIASDELARRLSLFIWAQPPDPDFLLQVRGAAPASSAAVADLAIRMLEDPRARPGLAAFYRWWLESDGILNRKKDAALFPAYGPALQQAMAAEGPAFGVHVTLDGDHRFPILLTAPFSLINEALAAVYGVGGVTGPALRVVALNDRQRAGVLTQPGTLARGASATNASASARGFWILRTLLCNEVPTTPGEEAGEPPDTTTNREWILASTANPTCAACHTVMDPIGFALGNFDAIGRFSTTEHGKLVDVSGRLPASPVGMVLNGPVELATRLAAHPQAHACFVEQWLRFALDRPLTPADDPARATVLARFTAAGLDIQVLIGSVAASDSFLAP